jgi:hypothetical protein
VKGALTSERSNLLDAALPQFAFLPVVGSEGDVKAWNPATAAKVVYPLIFGLGSVTLSVIR